MNNSNFKESANTAVITTKNIINGKAWVGLVTHDNEDGGWQFLEFNGSPNQEDAAVVSLQEITRIDPTLFELSDLPLGWQARRETKESPWIRGKQ